MLRLELGLSLRGLRRFGGTSFADRSIELLSASLSLSLTLRTSPYCSNWVSELGLGRRKRSDSCSDLDGANPSDSSSIRAPSGHGHPLD